MSRNFRGEDQSLHWLSADEWQWIRNLRAAATCARKTPYETKELAMRTAVQRALNSPPPFPNLKAYECPICQKWHLTKWKSKDERE